MVPDIDEFALAWRCDGFCDPLQECHGNVGVRVNIEILDQILPDGTEIRGFSSSPIDCSNFEQRGFGERRLRRVSPDGTGYALDEANFISIVETGIGRYEARYENGQKVEESFTLFESSPQSNTDIRNAVRFLPEQDGQQLCELLGSDPPIITACNELLGLPRLPDGRFPDRLEDLFAEDPFRR